MSVAGGHRGQQQNSLKLRVLLYRGTDVRLVQSETGTWLLDGLSPELVGL